MIMGMVYAGREEATGSAPAIVEAAPAPVEVKPVKAAPAKKAPAKKAPAKKA